VDLNGWPEKLESALVSNLVISAPERVASTVAQQIFVIGSGIAGGLAGFALAKEFAGIKDVPFRNVAGATLVSVLFTLGAGILLARSTRQEYY